MLFYFMFFFSPKKLKRVEMCSVNMALRDTSFLDLEDLNLKKKKKMHDNIWLLFFI